MKIGKRKAVVLVAMPLVAIIAWLAREIGGTEALLGFLVALVSLGFAGLGYLVVQSERLTRKTSLGPLTSYTRSQFAALAERLERMDQQLDRVEQASLRPGEHAEVFLRALKAGHRRLELETQRSLRGTAAEIEAGFESALKQDSRARRSEFLIDLDSKLVRPLQEIAHVPAEIDALMQLQRRLNLDDPVPLVAGFALSARGILQLVDLIEERRPKLIVECGSGTSTLFAAKALQGIGVEGARLVALEHLPYYAEETSRFVSDNGLDTLVEIRLADLRPLAIGDEEYQWYDVATVNDLDGIDLLLVDGPPGSEGRLARYPALPVLFERLNPGAIIMLDDARRPDEREIATRWLSETEIRETPAAGPDHSLFIYENENPH